MKRLSLALVLILVPSLAACRGAGDPVEALSMANALEVSNASVPEPGLLCAGQVSQPQLGALAEKGYGTFLSLRAPGEEGTGWEEPYAASIGIRYVNLPIRGAADISEENARRLDALLEELDRPLVLYCGSSNRVGALLGARAYFVQKKSREESLELARAAGMTRLEARLRELLEE
jgi:protein tyrosine phosphatase (PTP) superfamily phosphohydrolase (DUF442 family)